MTIVEALRGRRPTEDESASSHETEASRSAPFEGYDRMESSELIQKLADHSQAELEAVEVYERAHKSREAVLHKLRYLRGPEPLPGYDALDVDEILEAISETDDRTVKKIRGYERKFAKRPKLLEEVARVQRDRRASRPAVAPPAYQPQSGG
jgi:hypothetical protein